MALIPGEGRRDEGVDEGCHLVEGVLARTDRDHVRVVVLAGKFSGRKAPHEGRANAFDLVRGDLLTVPGASEDDPERLDTRRLVGDDSLAFQAFVAECPGQGVAGALALCAAMLRAFARREPAAGSQKLDPAADESG